jgi:hypothetical protein
MQNQRKILEYSAKKGLEECKEYCGRFVKSEVNKSGKARLR